VWRRDDVSAYQLASWWDDAAMRITEVVRGAGFAEVDGAATFADAGAGAGCSGSFHFIMCGCGGSAAGRKRHDALSVRTFGGRADGSEKFWRWPVGMMANLTTTIISLALGTSPDHPRLVSSDKIFLTAEWRHLAMLNYEVDARLLLPFVPAETELDCLDGKVFVSLVGFRFLRTRMFGWVAIPMHSNFEEVNLRFYVRRQVGNEVRRGVVFIQETVPRRAIL